MEELIDALKRIQNECKKHTGSCDECPFYINDDCKLNYDTPDSWNILDKPIMKVLK